MKRSQIWQGLAGLTLLMLAIISGCTRSLTVAPTAPAATATNTAVGGATNTFTRTYTPANTNTRTNTATPTNTGVGNTATSTSTASFTNTNSVTATPTNSNTNVPGATDTYTFTVTSTPTNSYTPTFTSSATNTNTNLPGVTNTSTSTVTATPTATVTSTATVAQCSEGTLQTAYPFDTTIGCWYQDPTATGSVVTAMNISTTTKHNGSGAMQVAVTEPATSKGLQIQLDYTAPQNLTGLTLTAWVYVDASLASSITGVQFFCQSTTNFNWTNGGGSALPTTNAGKWLYITWPITATDITQVNRIGLQFYGVPASATGNVYIDDVKLVAGLCNASSVVTSFPYEGSLNCWKVDSDSVAVVPDWGVTIGGPAHSGTGAMYATIAQGATAQAVKLDLNYAPDQNLTGYTINAWVWVDPSLADSTAQMFIQSGGGSGWTWKNDGGTAFPVAMCGVWEQISFNPATVTGWTATQSADVGFLGIQFSGMAANATGKIYIDDVTFTSAVVNTPTITSTPTITMTPVNTNTPIPGTTDTFTSTVTSTATVTSTNTAVPFPTTCNGTFKTAYTFDSSEECWRFDSATGITAYEISSSQVTQGTGALHIGFAEPATSVPVQIEQNFATQADMSGRTISAWVYVDPSMQGGGLNFFTQTAGWASFKNGGDVYLDATKVGKWIQVSWLLLTGVTGDLTKTDQVGIQFYNIPANATGNIYIDNITFSSPATPTNTPNAACTPILLNGCETLAENGTWGGSNSAFSISPLHATQGSNSLDVSVVTPPVGGWNDQFIQLSGFSPNTWTNSTQLVMDMYVDASVLAGTTYNQLYLEASTGGGGWQYIGANQPSLSVGANTVTFNLNWTGAIAATNPLDMMVIVLQTGGQSGTGNVYVDNVHLTQSCGGPPASTNTFTPIPTNTPTITMTPVDTDTPTITVTPVDTNTPLPGATDTFTSTVTSTATVTSTNTAVPFPTTCNGVFQTAYTFDSSEECWRFDSATGITAYEISSSQVTQGTGALHIGFAEPATSVPVQIEQNFATQADMSGRTISAWVYVDPSMQGGGLNFFTQTAGWASFKNGGDVYLDATKVGKWIQVSWLLLTGVTGDLTKTDQVGIQFYNIPANATGNIYIDNITFSSPATPTNTPNAACTPILLNGCETLAENGTWGGSNSAFSISPLHATQGSNSLDVSVVTPPVGGWNDQFIQLSGFSPNTWTNSTQLVMDMYVDASVLAGTTYNQLYLEASTGGGGWQYIGANQPSLSVGANTVTFNLNWTGAIAATNPLDMMVIVLQTGGQSGTGNVYVDNVHLTQNCP